MKNKWIVEYPKDYVLTVDKRWLEFVEAVKSNCEPVAITIDNLADAFNYDREQLREYFKSQGINENVVFYPKEVTIVPNESDINSNSDKISVSVRYDSRLLNF